METYQGVLRTSHPTQAKRQFETLLQTIPVLPFSMSVAKRCTQLREDLRLAGKRVHDRFTFPPPFDAPRFEYFAVDNKAIPYHIPAYAGPGYVLPSGRIDEMSITVTPATQMPSQQADILP